jgi:cytochrome c biogenesis protein CcdA
MSKTFRIVIAIAIIALVVLIFYIIWQSFSFLSELIPWHISLISFGVGCLMYFIGRHFVRKKNVFVKKDWLNILDNMNQNYSGNQSVVDTSQLSNSNKWLSYREAYFEIPLLLTLSTTAPTANFAPSLQAPNSIGLDGTRVVGLKSWFGQIIHSFTLD